MWFTLSSRESYLWSRSVLTDYYFRPAVWHSISSISVGVGSWCCQIFQLWWIFISRIVWLNVQCVSCLFIKHLKLVRKKCQKWSIALLNTTNDDYSRQLNIRPRGRGQWQRIERRKLQSKSLRPLVNFFIFINSSPVLEDEDSDKEIDEERDYQKVYDLLSTSSLS